MCLLYASVKTGYNTLLRYSKWPNKSKPKTGRLSAKNGENMEKRNLTALQRSLLDPDDFTLTFELVPGRGGRSRELSRILALAREIAADGRFKALSITENAGGHPALSPEALGAEILANGTDVIIHLSCKDKNRNQMESLLFAWDRLGLHNLLVIAGDYPKEGYMGYPKPVFDLDTVQALDMISSLNRPAAGGGSASSGMDVQPATFLKGVVVSPFKLLESELAMQYFKLHRKVAAGADFVITQLGFDGRKFHELLLYMRENGLHVPVLGNVFIPNLAVAELMYRGKIPGCVIPEELYTAIQQESRSQDKGRRARLLRGAKLLAIQRGLGYSGAHLGGPGLSFSDIDFILTQAKALAPDWQGLVAELSCWPAKSYYYKEEVPGGPSLPHRENGGLQGGGRRERWQPGYALSRLVHDLAFAPDGLLFGLVKRVCLALDDSGLRHFLGRFEHVVKTACFECQNCGDCTLAELAFLCPQSGCAKYLLNGPCGGSRDGWCEVYPGEKRCLYVLAYERLKRHGLQAQLREGLVAPRNWALNNSSSWVNFFRGLDHTGKKGD